MPVDSLGKCRLNHLNSWCNLALAWPDVNMANEKKFGNSSYHHELEGEIFYDEKFDLGKMCFWESLSNASYLTNCNLHEIIDKNTQVLSNPDTNKKLSIYVSQVRRSNKSYCQRHLWTNTIIYAILMLYLFTAFDWTFLYHVT